jgi:glycosyltransferase involved in cell wall biosynthesis
MKIAVNVRFLLKDKLEGVGRFTYEILQRMVKNHPETEFLFFFDRPYHSNFIFAPNVKPIVLFPPARHPFLYILWFEWAVARALKKYQADVFLSPDGFLSLRTDIPTVMVVHDIAHTHYREHTPFLVYHYYAYFVPKFIQKAAQVVTVSHFVKKDILQNFVLQREPIVCFNAGRDVFKPLNQTDIEAVKTLYSNGKPYFLYVGAVHPRKNVDRLITAFDTFKTNTGSDFKLLIGGRVAWQASSVQKAYQSARFQEDILFLGFVEDNILPKIVASAYALVYVSLSEGFGIPLLEAMYCDVPVITSDATSMPEVAGDAAILVNPTNIQSIAEAMEQLADNQLLRNSLIEKGRVQRTKFDWNESSEKLYQSIIRIRNEGISRN